MRAVPMMRVEVDGEIVRRPGVLEVLQVDAAGKPVISHIRPQLQVGETLRERVGLLPTIVRAPA